MKMKKTWTSSCEKSKLSVFVWSKRERKKKQELDLKKEKSERGGGMKVKCVKCTEKIRQDISKE